MNYKIWRKDKNEWSLAFDEIFKSKQEVDDRIKELNAAYYNLVRYNELNFYAYSEDIKLTKNGSVIDNKIHPYKQRRYK
jgi:hypothetical protein